MHGQIIDFLVSLAVVFPLLIAGSGNLKTAPNKSHLVPLAKPAVAEV